MVVVGVERGVVTQPGPCLWRLVAVEREMGSERAMLPLQRRGEGTWAGRHVIAWIVRAQGLRVDSPWLLSGTRFCTNGGEEKLRGDFVRNVRWVFLLGRVWRSRGLSFGV